MVTENHFNKNFMNNDLELFYKHLIEKGYRVNIINHYKFASRKFDKFMFENNIMYSRKVIEEFLNDALAKYSISTYRVLRCTLNHFDAYINGAYPSSKTKALHQCPIQFNTVFTEYINYLKSKRYKPRTIQDYEFNLLKVMKTFDEYNLESIEAITVEDIYNLSKIKNLKRSFFSVLRQFLRYLFKENYVATDYSYFVSSVRYSRPVPSVYKKNEISKILNCIDLETHSSKRNYAIILLALRLGIRTGDIVKLKFTDVDFLNKEIKFTQEKTQVCQRLELLPEIENALLTYISVARPKSDITNIFLSAIAPIRAITPAAIYGVVSQYIDASGIDVGVRSKGAHALRMTFASELVSERVPYDVVRKILGHEDPLTIKHYVKFDIESLRTCAIEVPLPTGRLSEYISTRLGGDINEVCL